MESITIKLDESLAKEMEKAMHPDYTTKTEFIREAIRDKLKEIRRELVWQEFSKYRGKLKSLDISEEKLEEIRGLAIKELAKGRGWKLD